MTDDQYGDDQYGDRRGSQQPEQHGDQRAEGAPRGGGRWDPLPQGDYDDGATAFVKLPEGASTRSWPPWTARWPRPATDTCPRR